MARVQVGPVPQQSWQNLLTNPGHNVWQRGNGPFSAASAWCDDRWFIGLHASGNSISVTRDTTHNEPSTPQCVAITAVVAGGPEAYLQRFTNNYTTEPLPSLIGRTISFSMRVMTSTPNAVRIGMFPNSGVGNIVSPYHPGDGQWHTLSVSGVVPSGQVFLDFRLDFEASATAYAGPAVVNLGSVPAPYIPVHPAEELVRCQRYYEIIGGAQDGKLNFTDYAQAGNQLYHSYPQKVQKVTNPIITVVGAWNNGNVQGGTFNGASANISEIQLDFIQNASGGATMFNGPGMYITLEGDV